jgi:LPXTG-site transpeptidase (sortase) family protein
MITAGSIWWALHSEIRESKGTYVVTYSTNTPDESSVEKATYKWLGADDEPKYIELPTIGAEGFVQKVGVDQNKQVAVPSNIHFAGWYVSSAKPGQTGLSIIDGHVTGRYHDAVFKDLTKLKVGDIFQIELGSGEVKKYRVIGIQSVMVDQANSLLFSQDAKVSSQLNLITCTGDFDITNQLFNKRLIVYSQLDN